MADFPQKYKIYVVEESSSIIDILRKQERYKVKTVIVVNQEKTVLGTVSDGDLRRFFLENKSQPAEINDVLQRDFFFAYEHENIEKRILAFDISNGVVPIVNKKLRLVGIYDGIGSTIDQDSNALKKFTSIAPARIAFAGGGSDVTDWFISDRGKCINGAIDLYARINFRVRDDDNFNINSTNTGENFSINKKKLKITHTENLLINCLKKFPKLPGLDIQIYCDFPPNSGLGGSSSLCVALLQGCANITQNYLKKSELWSLAYAVERYDSKILGGWQDQIAAVSGGLNISCFEKKGIKSTKIYLSDKEQEELNSCMFLFRVGKPRSSSEIHAKLAEEINKKPYAQKMAAILKISDEVEEIIQEREFNQLGYFLDKGWQLKRELSDHISTPEIDGLYELLISFGASGGRLLGAGKGGFILMFVEIGKQPEFIKNCEVSKISYQRFKFDMSGARIIGESN